MTEDTTAHVRESSSTARRDFKPLGPANLRVEIHNDVLEGRDRLLNGRDFQELCIVDRPDAILKRNDELTPPLSQLDER